MEKLCLALYFTCTKLRAYLWPIIVYLISKINLIKYIFTRPISHQRLSFWSLSLFEFDIQHVPQKAVKNQSLADFLVAHLCVSMDKEVVMVNPLRWEYQYIFIFMENCTNNQVEYEVLVMGLELLIDIGVKNVSIKGD